jgi:hypothetical protein
MTPDVERATTGGEMVTGAGLGGAGGGVGSPRGAIGEAGDGAAATGPGECDGAAGGVLTAGMPMIVAERIDAGRG